MHRTSKPTFAEMPLEAKAVLILLPLAWLVFVVGQAMIHGTVSVVQLGMGGLCCMLVFSLKSWGRWLCGAYNILLVASMVNQGPESFGGMLPMAIMATLFAGATVALFLPGTATVFRHTATGLQADKSAS